MRTTLALLLIASVAGCSRTPLAAQRNAARRLAPRAFWKDLPDPKRPPRKLRARVWVQDDYRRQVLGAQLRLYRTMGRANRVLAARLGIEVEIVSIKSWSQSSRLSGLEVSLEALEALDPGEGVDFVLGMVTPLPAATSAIHQLGMARLLGKHLVLRGMDDAKEFLALNRAFDLLDSEERERLYVERREHKEVVVLLHELGHALGALHVRSPRSVMTPAHDHAILGFSPQNLDLAKISLKARGAGEVEPADEVRKKLQAFLQKAPSEVFVGFSRERMLALLGAPAQLARATDREVLAADDPSLKKPGYNRARAPARNSADQSPAARLSEARALASKGKTQAALSVIQPALAAPQAPPELLALGCELQARLHPKAEATLALCQRASGAAALLILSYVHLERGESARALSVARRAEDALSSKDAQTEQLELLAQLYQRLRALTWAETVAQRLPLSGTKTDVLAWVKRTKAELGSALDWLRPEDQPRYYALRRAMERAIQSGDLKAAQEAANALKKRFPKASGPAAVLCAQLGEARRFAEAKAPCEQAAAEDARAIRPRLVLGMGAFARGRPKAAIKPLQEALQISEESQDIWRLLAAAYQATGQQRRFRKLKASFRAKFGASL